MLTFIIIIRIFHLLVLTRKKGETIRIVEYDITIKIVSITSNGTVKMMLIAPDDVELEIKQSDLRIEFDWLS